MFGKVSGDVGFLRAGRQGHGLVEASVTEFRPGTFVLLSVRSALTVTKCSSMRTVLPSREVKMGISSNLVIKSDRSGSGVGVPCEAGECSSLSSPRSRGFP